MRLLRASSTLVALAIVAGCQQGDTLSYDEAPLDTENQRASYSLGLDYGAQLSVAANRIEMAALVRGIRDAMEERDPALSDPELMAARQAFAAAVREEMAAEGEATLAAGRAFMEENGAREGVMTTESGLQYEVLEAGDGPSPTAEDNVTIHYTGTLIDGTEFDSSVGGPPATFNAGRVIPGFSEGLQLMSVGSRYRIWIPAELAYGPNGSPPAIGPNEALIFEIELISIGDAG